MTDGWPSELVQGTLDLLLSQFVAAFLYKTNVIDPVLWAVAVIALGVACASATYFPARRAANVEPSVALRIE